MEASQLHALIEFLGGLGLFLSSVTRIAAQTVQLGGRQLRHTLARHASNRALPPLAGTVLGALLPSASGVTAILVGLIVAGVLNVQSAMQVLLWANIGSSALVLVASIDLRLLGLAVLGLAGVWLHVDRSGPEPRRTTLELLLTLSLLLLGIGLMHTGIDGLSAGSDEVAAPLKTRIIQMVGASDVLALLLGMAGAILTQSASGMTITIMAAFHGGLLGETEAMTVVIGAVTGAGAASFIKALFAGRGSSRMLSIYQGMTKVAGALLVLGSLAFERATGLPLIEHLIDWISTQPSRHLALTYLVCESAPLLIQAVAAPWIERALRVLAPPAAAESLAHPRFIYPEAISDPDIALVLAGKEQQRVAQLLPGALPGGAPPADAANIPPEQVGVIGARLASDIGMFLATLAGAALNREQTDLLANLQSRNEALRGLHETLADLTRTMHAAQAHNAARALASALGEGLGALLLCVDDAAQSGGAFDIDLLLQLSSDRGDVVDGMRRRVIGAEGRIDPASQQSVYMMTSLFERAVWLIQRYASQLQASVAAG